MAVIQKLIETYKLWQEFIKHFPKTSRYTLGAKIDFYFIKTIEFVLIASYKIKKEEKFSNISKASIKLDLLKFFLQVTWEIKALDNKKYILLSQKLDEIGKMVGGWQNSIKKSR